MVSEHDPYMEALDPGWHPTCAPLLHVFVKPSSKTFLLLLGDALPSSGLEFTVYIKVGQ